MTNATNSDVNVAVQKKVMHHSVSIVDNLAEITSHHDRNVLEKSLLKTLNELFKSTDLRLYRVRLQRTESQHDLSLLAYCVNSVIVSSEQTRRGSPSDNEISEALSLALESEDVQIVQRKDSTGCHLAYPAFDAHGEIFAVMLMTSDQIPSPTDQRLIYGILKVYSNYLSLIEKTQRDKLTGLFNRETLDSEITKLLVGKGEEKAPVAVQSNDARKRGESIRHWLGVVDIDHFKSINDSYGHLYGDEVIILVARLMTSGCMRDDDLVYRYGGEEFVVLLTASDEKDAYAAFDRMRGIIDKHQFPQVAQVTASIGFVEIAGQQSPSDAIGEADAALYYAKQNGRNQVHSYRELSESGKIKVSTHVAPTDVELF